MKIAIVGTHGIGKTTLAYQIACEAKKKGKNATVINEIARRCPFPLNDEQTPDGLLCLQLLHWRAGNVLLVRGVFINFL